MFEVRRQAETGSTNDDAARLLGEPGSAGLVLRADFQHAGRGRRARAWIAPAGSALLFTAILPEPLATEALWSVPFWTALGVAAGIETASGARVALQWPNDLLLDGRKCCGILCISRVSGARAWVGCGVGLNVTRPEHDAQLAALEPPPAFLSDTGGEADADALLRAILAEFERRLGDLRDPSGVARAWERRAGLEGTRYSLLLDGATAPFEGTARRLADDGGLVVAADGEERTIGLADARVLRG